MILDSEKAAQLRSRKFLELFRLINDPLLTNTPNSTSSTVTNADLETVRRDYDVAADKKFALASLNGLKTDQDLRDALTRAVKAHIYHPKQESVLPLKRKAEDAARADFRPPKLQKVASSHLSASRLVTNKIARPKSAVTSLAPQSEVLQQQTNLFLNRDLSEVDIVSVPEHYPTSTHNVSSLAELYYLTQTLPLIKLLPGSHKTLTTDDFELALLEGKIAVLYSRIEELKRQGKWLLRQPVRYYDPFLYKAQRPVRSQKYTWDHVVEEGQWLAADFKETAKYRRACCVAMAQAVSDFWTYGRAVCIHRKKIRHIGDPIEIEDEPVKLEDVEMAPASAENVPIDAPSSFLTIDLDDPEPETIKEEPEASLLPDAIKTEPLVAKEEPVPDLKDIECEPSAIDVKLLQERPRPEDEIVVPELPKYLLSDLAAMGILKDNSPFKLHIDLNSMKKLDQLIVRNLPKFTAFDDEDTKSVSAPAIKPTEPPIVAVSRLLHSFDDDDQWHKIVLKESVSAARKAEVSGPPEYQKGLFGFQSHRRFNYLKPPKPPLIKNIEFRLPTIWLPQDDRYLIHYVAEFCFNWELISEHLLLQASTLRKYESNIERRTPWQCFERYIQLNEKFQFSDMKGVYSYQAQQWLEQAHRAQLTTKRRISPLGVGNESIQRGHRRLRWASMFDAMRRTMRNRETQAAKINHRKAAEASGSNSNITSAGNNGSGTNNGANNTTGAVSGTNINSTGPENTLVGNSSPDGGLASPSGAATPIKRAPDLLPTPAELSKLKFERDKSMQETYLNQQATRSRMMAAVSQQKSQSQHLLSPPPLAPKSRAQATPGPLQRLPLGQQPVRTPTGGLEPGRTAPVAVQQAQLGLQRPQQPSPVPKQAPGAATKRPTTPNGTPYTPEQLQQLLQLQKQRRMMQQQGQAVKTGVSGAQTNPLVGGRPANVPLQQPQQSGVVQNSQQPQQGKPAASKARIHFAPAQVLAIINSIQSKNPNLSKEQVTKLAATYLANLQQQQQNRPAQGPSSQVGARPAPPGGVRQPQVATLTPQERNQLQMLKAAKTAHQQQLQQHHQLQQLQQLSSASTSPVMGNASLDAHNLLKLQYEERKKLLIQKHQQQQRLGMPLGELSPGMPNSSLNGNPSSGGSPQE